MNIAIVIGVPEYINLPDLPACRGDVLAMKMLLEANGKYQHIYDNIGKYDSKEIKGLLREIADIHQEQEIDELLFYFSGHGTIDKELIYCCKDFEENSPRITSVRNTEIDTILRSLAPKTAVKIIDACHSGMKTIKDADAFAKSLQSPSFSNFIQFASSMEDQVSFAGEKLSMFTEHFIKAACLNITNKVLYIDIENYLIDVFDGKNQTPYFVAQRTGREVFCEIGSNLSEVVSKILMEISHEPKTKNSTVVLKNKISQIKSRYVDIGFAATKMTETEGGLFRLSLEEAGQEFYKISVVRTENYSGIPNLRSIAQDLAATRKSRPEHRPLVKIDYEEKLIDIPVHFSSWIFGEKKSIGDTKEEKPQKKLVSVPFRIMTTLNLPFGSLQITAMPDIKSLPPITLILVFVPFRTTCRVYAAYVTYEMIGWDEYARNGQLDWQFLDSSWADLPSAVLTFAPIPDFPSTVEDSITQYAESAPLVEKEDEAE